VWERDNSNQVFIKNHWICSLTKIIRVVKEMKKVEVKNLRKNEWEIDQKLVIKEGKIYVPKDKELRIEII